MSVLLSPNSKIEKIGQISLLSAISVAQGIEDIFSELGQDFSYILKWPNDILVAGKKCSGILLETEACKDGSAAWLVLGIGVNVAYAPKDVGSALHDIIKRQGQGYRHSDINIEINQVRDAILSRLKQNYMKWRSSGFNEFQKIWLDNSFDLLTPISVGKGKFKKSGFFDGIDENGCLLLKSGCGRKITVNSNEIFINE